MECKDRLVDYLTVNQVPFEVQRHPTAYTAQRVAESEHIPGRMVAKAVMVFVDDKPAMLVLPADFRVHLGKAAAALGTPDVRLAHEEEFAATFPDCEVGALHPFGNLYRLPVYVDQTLTEDAVIIFRAGSHTETMSVRYADYQRLVAPTVVELALHV
jgi:Ala-tRNA(Pro) deacylase